MSSIMENSSSEEQKSSRTLPVSDPIYKKYAGKSTLTWLDPFSKLKVFYILIFHI